MFMKKLLSSFSVFLIAFSTLLSAAFLLPTPVSKKAEAFVIGGDPNGGGEMPIDSPCPGCGAGWVPPPPGGNNGDIGFGIYPAMVMGASAFGGENQTLMEQQRYVPTTEPEGFSSGRVQYPYPYGSYGSSSVNEFKTAYKNAGSPCRSVKKYYYDEATGQVVQDNFWGGFASNPLGVSWVQERIWVHQPTGSYNLPPTYDFYFGLPGEQAPLCVDPSEPSVVWRECPVKIDNVTVIGPYGKLVNTEGPGKPAIVRTKEEAEKDPLVLLQVGKGGTENLNWDYLAGEAPGAFAERWNRFQEFLEQKNVPYQPAGRINRDWVSKLFEPNLPEEFKNLILQYGISDDYKTSIWAEVQNCGKLGMRYNFGNGTYLVGDEKNQIDNIERPGNYEAKGDIHYVRCHFYGTPLWESNFTIPGSGSQLALEKKSWQNRLRFSSGDWYGCKKKENFVNRTGEDFWTAIYRKGNWDDNSRKKVIQNVEYKAVCSTTDSTKPEYYNGGYVYSIDVKNALLERGVSLEQILSFGEVVQKVTETRPSGQTESLNDLGSGLKDFGIINKPEVQKETSKAVNELVKNGEFSSDRWRLPQGSLVGETPAGYDGSVEYKGVFNESIGEGSVNFNALWWSNAQNNTKESCPPPTNEIPYVAPIVTCEFTPPTITPEDAPPTNGQAILLADGKKITTTWSLTGSNNSGVVGGENLIVKDGSRAVVVKVHDRKTYLTYNKDEGYKAIDVGDGQGLGSPVRSRFKLYSINPKLNEKERAEFLNLKTPLPGSPLMGANESSLTEVFNFYKGTVATATPSNDKAEVEKFTVSTVHTFKYDYVAMVYEFQIGSDGAQIVQVPRLFENQPGSCSGDAEFFIIQTRVGSS